MRLVLCDCARAEKHEHLIVLLGPNMDPIGPGSKLTIDNWNGPVPHGGDFIRIGVYVFEILTNEFAFGGAEPGTPLAGGVVIIHGGWGVLAPDEHLPSIEVPDTKLD